MLRALIVLVALLTVFVWWLKDSPAPTPLVSTGVLGTPGTSVLLGGRDIDTGEFPGGRITIGYRFGTERR